MSPPFLRFVVIGGIASLSLLVTAGSARATGTRRSASALCQTAFTNDEGAIRTRPRTLQNQGGATAFVTCNFVAVT